MASKRLILTIEDNSDTLIVYQSLLELDGYQVYTAQSGEEGLRMFNLGKFDAVILDLSMPDMSGVDVLKEIRQVSRDIPVIVMTGSVRPGLREQCEQLGVQGYVLKPAIEDLIESIASLFSREGRRLCEQL